MLTHQIWIVGNMGAMSSLDQGELHSLRAELLYVLEVDAT